jgi:hypothetical protein
VRRVALLVLAAGAALVPGASAADRVAHAARRAAVVEQLVVFSSGHARQGRVSTRGVLVRVGRRRCAVPTGTALAALVRSRVARVRLRDFASCSRRARDAGGLFVRAIGHDRNHGRSGWVYKVGGKAATAGAADPSGPFGRGRLRSGQRVTWFYCRDATNCQRTLAMRARADGGGAVTVTVAGYDDRGRGVRVAGALVRVGTARAVTGSDGVARLTVAPGRYRAFAVKRGLVRSFSERVLVR